MLVHDFITPAEFRQLRQTHDLKAAGIVIGNWGIVASAFAFAYLWTNPLSILIALILIAGRQHGIGGLMHECGHRTMFSSRAVNRFVGQWLAAKPVFEEIGGYARGHGRHHLKAGTLEDPDRGNFEAYPVSKDSFRRKMIRDLSGQTGLRRHKEIIKATFGIFSAEREKRENARPFISMWLIQLSLLLILHITMHAWLYLLWIGANLTIYMAFIRIRQIAEHAAVPDPHSKDVRRNTRTTYGNFLERLTVAPNYVNFHVEHHLFANVPCYNLKALHNVLKQKGAYDSVRIFPNYLAVLRHVTCAAKPLPATP